MDQAHSALQNIAHGKTLSEAAYIGRKPNFSRDQMATVSDLLGNGMGISAIAKVTACHARQSIGYK